MMVGSVFQMSIQDTKRKISELLKLVELNDAKSRIIAKYSAGMRQRIGIAQALIRRRYNHDVLPNNVNSFCQGFK
ncbi:MAG: hypothetical protein EAX91_04365 [Candidatus Lokiarchaeota archaeon]|nr:hypothetical protein [Candidatus Lokiarchaeota archaeon]